MKCVSCKDMGVDCPWIGKADDMDGLIEKTKNHAMENHKDYWNEKMSKMSDEDVKNMTMPHVKDC